MVATIFAKCVNHKNRITKISFEWALSHKHTTIQIHTSQLETALENHLISEILKMQLCPTSSLSCIKLCVQIAEQTLNRLPRSVNSSVFSAKPIQNKNKNQFHFEMNENYLRITWIEIQTKVNGLFAVAIGRRYYVQCVRFRKSLLLRSLNKRTMKKIQSWGRTTYVD